MIGAKLYGTTITAKRCPTAHIELSWIDFTRNINYNNGGCIMALLVFYAMNMQNQSIMCSSIVLIADIFGHSSK